MTILLLCLCYLLSGITNSLGHPSRDYRPRRSFPHQAMMFSGFYGRPNHVPQTSMTAFATKDTIATNTFAGNDYPHSVGPVEDTEDEETDVQTRPEIKPELTENTHDEATVEEDLEVTTTVKPKRDPKRKHKPIKPQLDEEDEESESGSNWPLQSGRRGVPGYNAFFPIIFGGRGATSRSGDYEGGYPGSATAIANSFSTGKGGVASSHATAYGDPYLSMLLRNGGNGKRRNLAKNYD